MPKNRWTRFLTLALLAATAGACDQGTGPEDDAFFDTETALTDYQAMDSILANHAMQGFRALAGHVSFQTFGVGPELAAAGATDLLDIKPDGDPRAFAARIAKVAQKLIQGPSRAPLISDRHRGKTFVWDPGLGHYVIDESLTDGPPTGVRFLLYAPDASGQPNPDEIIGRADFIDEGDTSTEDVALRL